MNRAQKIMTSVMASLAVTAPVQSDGVSMLLEQAMSQEQTDPRATKAADDIFKWIEPIHRVDAKTLKEIVKQFPQYPPALIQQALKDDRILKTPSTETGEVRYYGHRDGGVSD
jgi:hypothetical protein